MELNETMPPYQLNINGITFSREMHAFDTLQQLASFVCWMNVIVIHVPDYGKEHLIESVHPIRDRYVIGIYVQHSR